MQALAIILLCVASAATYGVLHDNVTARVCVEYFTIGHPPVFDTDSPALLALGWGVIATWWVGLILGVPLALACRAGGRPKLHARDLVRPLLVLLAVMADFALAAGLVGYALARSGKVYLIGRMAHAVPPEKHSPFIADLWAHTASYAVGFIGGVVLIIRTIIVRRRAGGLVSGYTASGDGGPV